MIVKSLFIPKHKILLASYLFLLADISFLTFFFLDSGGEIVFCHNVIFSPEYGSCSETVELFHIPLLIFSGIITILAIKTLYYACSTSPDYKDSLKKFLKFFIPSSILLLLLGLIPISAGFGLLGSVNIFLFFPFLDLL